MAAGAVAVPHIVAFNYAPGQSVRRSGIDAGTKIEISCDTPGTHIYFTIDGSRPGESSRSTRKYKQPFALPAGRYTVRAVAVTLDGRESSVASKTFNVTSVKSSSLHGHVEYADSPRGDGLNFVNDMSARGESSSRRIERSRTYDNKEELSKKLNDAWAEEQHTLTRNNYETTIHNNPEEIFSSGLYRHTRSASQTFDQTRRSERNQFDRRNAQDASHLYTCARCGLRLHAGASRCTVCDCESILVTTLPLTDSLPPQTVPPTTFSQTQASAQPPWATRPFSCLSCGVTNPGGVTHCVSCNQPLSTTQAVIPVTSPPVIPTNVTHARCRLCGRLNDVRARFCDWCSEKIGAPEPELHLQTDTVHLCPKCNSKLSGLNRPCLTCGTLVGPTAYPMAQTQSNFLDRITKAASVDPFSNPDLDNMTFKVNKGIQTIQSGSFVSGQDVNATPRSGRAPFVSSISPGRGYWRQQLKHCYGQLEAFASSSADFRAAIGPHQIGRLLSARVTNSGGDELVVRLAFNLPQHHNQRQQLSNRDTMRYGAHNDRGIHSVMEKSRPGRYEEYNRRATSEASRTRPGRKARNRYEDVDDYIPSDKELTLYPSHQREDESSIVTYEDDELITGSSEMETVDNDILDTFRDGSSSSHLLYGSKRKTNYNFSVTPRRAGRKSLQSQKKKSSDLPMSPGKKNAMLALKELGTDGAGDVKVLIRLFSDEQYPVKTDMKTRDGWSLAHLAVINRHPDAIPVIGQYGESEDVLSMKGPVNVFGNTPLHEAVRLSTASSSALRALDVLLKCGADVTKRNDRGETPYEYAKRLKHQEAAEKIASQIGQRRLQAAGLGNRDSKYRNNEKDGTSD